MDNLVLNSVGFVGKLKARGQDQKEHMDYYCQLCKRDFKDPRLLNCFHSFCTPCLEDFLISNYNDGSFKCPLCNEEIEVPANGARGFPKNKFVFQNAEVKTLFCDNCVIESKARGTCIDCNNNLCKICLVNHNAKKWHRSHKVVPIGNDFDERKLCSIHRDQELLFYCNVCNVPICSSCNATDHKFHPSKEIPSTSRVLKEHLGTSLQKLGLNRDAEDTANKAKEQKRMLKIRQDDIISAIDEREKELHRIISELRTQFVTQIVKENEQAFKEIESNINSANKKASAVQELLRFGSLFLEQADDIDVISNTANLNYQVQKLSSSECPLKEVTLNTFHPSGLNASDIEMQRVFGSCERRLKRPKEIKTISKLDQLRHRNSTNDVLRSASDPLNYSVNTNADSPRHVTKDIRSSRNETNKIGITCTDGTITGIDILPDGTICACLGFDSLLELYSSSGRRKSKIRFRQQLDDVVAKSSNTLYVSSNSDKRIYRVNVANERKEVFAETRSCVRGLTLGKNGSLLACLTKRGSFLEEQSEGCIMEITRDNSIDKTFESNRLKYPARLALGKDRQIVVSDWMKMSILICRDGRTVSTYSGCRDSDKEREFVPRGVCCLSNGDIVALNFSSNSLHWLTPNGSLKRIIPLKSHDCWSIAVDHDDTIWVGTNHGYIFPVELL